MDDPSPKASIGLSSEQARARLAIDGPNSIAATRHRTLIQIALNVLREPMLALLAASGVIYALIGEPSDPIVLLGLAMLSIAITVIQEARTERAIEALAALTSPKALVIRDGVPVKVDAATLVVGDVLQLAEGDRVPADGMIVSGEGLEADESLLTGESVPVRKRAATAHDDAAAAVPGGDDLPHLFAGSLIVHGQAHALIIATGPRSEIGKIGRSLDTIETEPPRLQKQTRRLVLIFALIGGAVTLLVAVLYGLLRSDWIQGILAGIALGMAMLPEEFPVVLTVFMAMGAWRMSRRSVLARRASAIESLGSATVLCTDKTGTLTQNRMSIAEIRLATGETYVADELDTASVGLAELVECGRLASAPNPFDPMERALHELGGRRNETLPNCTLAKVHGLSQDLLAITQVWQPENDSDDLIIATKGAPEAIASLCQMSDSELKDLRSAVDAMAANGRRVLAVAKATQSDRPWQESPRRYDFQFLGLVGFVDPLRPSARPAVELCRNAGIRVVMITGDYPATARAIAAAAGIDARKVLTGTELSALDDDALARAVRDTSVFARVLPVQKLRIVNALKANGEIVAMTGDGVNDAPSLKSAHIGVAMGKRGTDVAREASDIVLLEDDFGSIVEAVRLGRRTYDNLRKSMGFILAVHVPIAGLALFPLLFGLPLLFGPVHIALIEMVVDPSCTLVFEAEPEEDDIMRRPPRKPDEPLFSPSLVIWAALQGLAVLAASLAAYALLSAQGLGPDSLRAGVFATLVGSLLSLILVNRTFRASLLAAFTSKNLVLAVIAAAVLAMLVAALSLGPRLGLFGFGPLTLQQAGIPALGAILVLVVLELIKPLWRKRLVGTVA